MSFLRQLPPSVHGVGLVGGLRSPSRLLSQGSSPRQGVLKDANTVLIHQRHASICAFRSACVAGCSEHSPPLRLRVKRMIGNSASHGHCQEQPPTAFGNRSILPQLGESRTPSSCVGAGTWDKSKGSFVKGNGYEISLVPADRTDHRIQPGSFIGVCKGCELRKWGLERPLLTMPRVPLTCAGGGRLTPPLWVFLWD